MFWKRKPRSPQPDPSRSGDPEIAALRAEIARRQEQIAALELELFDLDRFVADVEMHLGPLQRRLEDLRAQLAGARRRSPRRARRAAYPDSFDGVEAGDRFGRQDASTEQAEAPPPPPPAPEPFDESREAEIKSLYRSLAKRFHPDLTTAPEEKRWRAQMMAQVNAAYAARDLEALRALAARPDWPTTAPVKTRADLVAELRAEIERLGGVMAGLERTLDQRAATPAVQFKLEVSLARHGGQNLLGEMAAQLEAEIARAEAELAALR